MHGGGGSMAAAAVDVIFTTTIGAPGVGVIKGDQGIPYNAQLTNYNYINDHLQFSPPLCVSYHAHWSHDTISLL